MSLLPGCSSAKRCPEDVDVDIDIDMDMDMDID